MVNRSGLAMNSKMAAEKVSRKELDYAVRLHGHLGPFLVIGVRMGKLANGMFRGNRVEDSKFQVTIKVPQTTPFTCAIDGIQSSTRCTIGNQRLTIKNSGNEISGSFGLRNSKRIVTISLKQKVMKDLMDYFKDGAKSEELARKVASMSNYELFAIEVSELGFGRWKIDLMGSDLDVAKGRLTEAGLTLVVVKNLKVIFRSRRGGVNSFLEAIDRLGDRLEDASVADKVVGRAVALLCIYSHVRSVYGEILSRTAKAFLEENSVHVESGVIVDDILNADKTGLCPFERLVNEIRDPEVAYRKLADFYSENSSLKFKR